MRNIYFLLFFTLACGKPIDPTKANYPIYGSLTTIISATEQDCVNCIMIEINNRNIRISFSNNYIDECSGQGSLYYLADSNTNLPNVDGQITNILAFVQNPGAEMNKNPICFPSQLDMEFEQFTNPNGTFYKLDYRGKLYTLKRLN